MNSLIAELVPSTVKPVGGAPAAGYSSALAAPGEIFSFQLWYTLEGDLRRAECEVSAESGLPAELFSVEPVPARFPCYPECRDSAYITKEPALLPDLLAPASRLAAVRGTWRSVWCAVDLGGAAPGTYPVKLTLRGAGCAGCEKVFTLTVIPARLPEQTLIYTQWFHSDCIAQYYGAEVFSERYWELTEKFMRLAARFGQNMILTPVFTPPLDTAPGTERPTVQLVGVREEDGKYSFDFGLLDRWIETASAAGFGYYEISHLFTQWGAEHAPKIIASTPRGERRIFGWETDAKSPEYRNFLTVFLNALCAHLRELGVLDRCRFHVSDEPAPESIENYRAAASVVKPVVGADRVIDALSHIEYYNEGLVAHPVAATSAIEPFIGAGVPGLWAYYCCSQGEKLSNRFIAMNGGRTRVIGLQLYKFGIEGFLHWGYNFYNTCLSLRRIDPFADTDGDCSFPSGDPFTVYPGKDGPLSSLRQYLFYEGLCDMRAARLLESLEGRGAVIEIIEEDAPVLTFSSYRGDDMYAPSVRQKIYRRILEVLK